ncbi:MAG: hypothetical protein M1830_004616 [Pleopsidium flavum]|nr:MAG: hypothetical protein M1830_004616 [Pleopsidium flavum]
MRTTLRAVHPCFRSRPFKNQRCRLHNCLGSGAVTVSSRRSYVSVSAAELRFGQPVHETHPHLLKAGEGQLPRGARGRDTLNDGDLVTPGITALEYAHRRAKLASKLPDNSIAVIAASDIKYRSGAVFYEFHQDSNFFYLTGFNEPEALAIIEKTGKDGDHRFHLYVRPTDAKAAQWDGARSGTQAALDVFNADETGDVSKLHKILPSIVAEASEVYTDIQTKDPTTTAFGRFFSGALSKAEGFAKIVETSRVKPLKSLINDLRVLKSQAEIANMRKAGQASGRAFTEAMRQEWTREKDLAAFLDYQFKIKGCDSSAYVPVIAGGVNALSIHYVRNDDVLKDGQLVLADAGGEYGGYITDITRCWPVSGRFSEPQKDLYEAILKVQRSCVAMCREDANLSLDKLHEIAENGLREQLKQLGFDVSGKAIDTLFPHHLGHYIGLDVHDSPGYPRRDSLKAGQCVTIEPGLYIPNDDRWPEQFRGIGIRIEDSVCVQENGPLVFSTEAVKEVVDIEALASR